MKQINVAILGFGTVGAGVYKLLTQNNADYMHKEDLDFDVQKILIRGFDCEPNINLAPRSVFVTDFEALLRSDAQIVVECMGGTEPARSFILQALQAGKTVVTSNKEVFAKFWPDFENAAKQSGAGLYFEATAGGGIPIIRTLLDAMQANNIQALMGIVNGTTNYILTKMTQEGASYEQVLKEAQALGYAEADPAADVEGWDCVYKLAILASLAFHARVDINSIFREGITAITPMDIQVAAELGYVIKLLAIGKKIGGAHGQLQVRVHPTMIPKDHPLASVNGVFNAIFLHGHAVDDIMLYGRGAGQMPTASAVVSDVIYAAKAHKHAYMSFNNNFGAPQTLVLQEDWISAYAVRITVDDTVGVLAQVTKTFASKGVSIHSVSQHAQAEAKCAGLLVITHDASESAVQATMHALKALPCVKSIDNLMRVEH